MFKRLILYGTIAFEHFQQRSWNSRTRFLHISIFGHHFRALNDIILSVRDVLPSYVGGDKASRFINAIGTVFGLFR